MPELHKIVFQGKVLRGSMCYGLAMAFTIACTSDERQ